MPTRCVSQTSPSHLCLRGVVVQVHHQRALEPMYSRSSSLQSAPDSLGPAHMPLQATATRLQNEISRLQGTTTKKVIKITMPATLTSDLCLNCLFGSFLSAPCYRALFDPGQGRRRPCFAKPACPPQAWGLPQVSNINSKVIGEPKSSQETQK